MSAISIPLVGGAYSLPQKRLSSQRAVNLFVELSERPSKTAAQLVATPGLKRAATIGSGPIRGMLVAAGALYVVSGNTVYKLIAGLTSAPIGPIFTSQGTVQMASDGITVLLVDGVGGYLVTIATGVLTKIADPDFPNGSVCVQFIDGYYVVGGGTGEGNFFWSTVYDGASWNGLDFANAEGSPDPVVGLIVDHRELWVFGENTIEVFGSTSNGFERLGNAFIEHGLAAAQSLAKMDNSIYWVQGDDRGDGLIYRANGYTPERISTHAIEDAIRRYSVISDAVAFTYQDRGHSFYVVSFPTADATWCFDASSGEWHERLYRDPNTGALHRYRAQQQAFFTRKQLVGDWENGRLYELSADTATDDGALILRLRSTQAAADADSYAQMLWSRMQVDILSGVGNPAGAGANPLMMMRYSDTGGYDWSSTRYGSIGRSGEYWTRCKWERCFPRPGQDGRARVWEVSWTDPVITGLLGASAFVTLGTD